MILRFLSEVLCRHGNLSKDSCEINDIYNMTSMCEMDYLELLNFIANAEIVEKCLFSEFGRHPTKCWYIYKVKIKFPLNR